MGNQFNEYVQNVWWRARRFIVFAVALVLCNVSWAATEYRLGPGDLISIIVYDEKDLSLENVRVPTNGIVSMPLLGNIIVENSTVHELETKVANALRQGYLKSPNVTVNILEYRPFFINGEVRKPGAYPYVDGLTVRKAITLAGGATERASYKKIDLIHEGGDENAKTIVDLETHLMPGDVLTIGESLF